MTRPQRALRPASADGVELIRVPAVAGAAEVLSPDALAFVAALQRRFGATRDELLALRRERRRRFDLGERPRFLAETAALREAEWTVAAAPADLVDRKVELVGGPDRATFMRAQASGANVFVADFEDSTSPTWENLVAGQANLAAAVRGALAPGRAPAWMMRPRGWHLPEAHVVVDGAPASASLVDFGLAFHHCARESIARGSGPYFYLPKLESRLEARLWNDVFAFAEDALGIAPAAVRATCHVETVGAAFEMDEILWELRERAAGLAWGRWDYVFSFVKAIGRDPATIVPDRKDLTTQRGCLDACVRLLVATCHRRGAHAIGGVAAEAPIEGDACATGAALAKVRVEKAREAAAGHDGTWVAHPDLVPLAREVFDAQVEGPNQLHAKRDGARATAEELLAIPAGTRTQAGLRHSVRVAVQYLEAWLRGDGCVPIYGVMEDAATVEIARAQVWQWIHHGVALNDGTKVTSGVFRRILDDELERIRLEVGDATFARGKFEEARSLFVRMSTSEELADFLTLPAYDLLVGARTGSVPAAATA
jgi:malate synthase A